MSILTQRQHTHTHNPPRQSRSIDCLVLFCSRALLVSDYNGHVLKYTASGAALTTYDSSHLSTFHSVPNPNGLALDSASHLYIVAQTASLADYQIVKLTTSGTFVQSLVGTTANPLVGPNHVTTDLAGNLYTGTYGNGVHNVLKLSAVFTPTPVSVPSSSSSSAALAVASSSSSAASSSSSTANGAGYGDPYFYGFWNQPYYVHGRAGDVYNILSDPYLQLNSRFVFLSNISCPVLPPNEPAKVHCSSHAGTYFGEFGLATASGDHLHIVGGDVLEGFHQVTVNGQEIEVGESYGPPPLPVIPHESHTAHALAPASKDASHPAHSSLYVHRSSYRSLIVLAGLYELLIENSDHYVDLVQVMVTDWNELLDEVHPSGLLGVSWNSTLPMPPSEEEHWERDGELMGCNIVRDKHCSAARQQ